MQWTLLDEPSLKLTPVRGRFPQMSCLMPCVLGSYQVIRHDWKVFVLLKYSMLKAERKRKANVWERGVWTRQDWRKAGPGNPRHQTSPAPAIYSAFLGASTCSYKQSCNSISAHCPCGGYKDQIKGNLYTNIFLNLHLKNERLKETLWPEVKTLSTEISRIRLRNKRTVESESPMSATDLSPVHALSASESAAVYNSGSFDKVGTQ